MKKNSSKNDEKRLEGDELKKAVDNLMGDEGDEQEESELEKRRRKETEARAERAFAEKVKAWAFKFEKTNRSKILVFYSGKGWHKIGGNSQLFYVHKIAKQIGRKPKVNVDRDFKCKFKGGIVSIKDVDALEEALKKLGIRVEKRAKGGVIFTLGEVVSDEEIKRLRAVEETKLAQFNSITSPKIILPSVNVRLNEVARVIFAKTKRRDKMMDEIFYKMRGQITEALTYFLLYSNGRIDAREGLERALKPVYLMLTELKIIQEQGLLLIDSCLSMAVKLEEVRLVLEKELKKL